MCSGLAEPGPVLRPGRAGALDRRSRGNATWSPPRLDRRADLQRHGGRHALRGPRAGPDVHRAGPGPGRGGARGLRPPGAAGSLAEQRAVAGHRPGLCRGGGGLPLVDHARPAHHAGRARGGHRRALADGHLGARGSARRGATFRGVLGGERRGPARHPGLRLDPRDARARPGGPARAGGGGARGRGLLRGRAARAADARAARHLLGAGALGAVPRAAHGVDGRPDGRLRRPVALARASATSPC